MSVAGTKNFDQPPHDSNRTHLVFSTSGLLLGSRAPLVFFGTRSPGLTENLYTVPSDVEVAEGELVEAQQARLVGWYTP